MMGYYYIDRKRWRIGVEDALVLVYLGMGLGIGYDNPLNFFFFICCIFVVSGCRSLGQDMPFIQVK